eukprot:5081386-Pyramimonas_sp.AAC.1
MPPEGPEQCPGRPKRLHYPRMTLRALRDGIAKCNATNCDAVNCNAAELHAATCNNTHHSNQ